MVSVAIVQSSLLVEARISTTEPAVLSAADGIYWAFSVLADGENVPVPWVVHIPVDVPPPILPFKNIEGFKIHTTWSGPASAVGGSSTTTSVVTGSVEHPLTVTTNV